MSAASSQASEKGRVEQAINDCIKWPFPTKNVNRLLSVIAQDPDFFIFHPDSRSTVRSFGDFKKMIDEVFMDEEMKPTETVIKDLRINLSASGTVAWFSCGLDDRGEFRGRKWDWSDARWTGVLEKREGHWLIVQMHFSLPTDRQQA